MNRLDPVEREYDRLIRLAEAHGDTPAAYELSIGLQQYRELFKASESPRELLGDP